MSHYDLDDDDLPGYFLPDAGQFRLVRLSDHVRFLARLAQPRTQDEERAAEPRVRMDELAFCLELLADQVDLVLDEVSHPVRRTGLPEAYPPEAAFEAPRDAGASAFRITLEQIDRLNRLIETGLTHARVVAVGDATGRAAQALPAIGDTLCDAADEMRALLLQIERQPLRDPSSGGVRETQAIYAVTRVAAPAAGGRLH
ncbi:hypothetical protein FHY12_003128 [Xanthomonas arboricola]|uniref:XAC0095 family protein n=1 Tax=Xanthomonas euroxanthea TaxID=2259622 RepID=UPI00141BC851|nr:hypothetical protein [Xanthomonas euroxanthea]NIK40803.1 hypothetical protein [Xanthomonas euroxanthea]